MGATFVAQNFNCLRDSLASQKQFPPQKYRRACARWPNRFSAILNGLFARLNRGV
jgi:hypothetical protein